MIAIDCFPLLIPRGGSHSFLYSFLKALLDSETDEEFTLLIPNLKDLPRSLDKDTILELKKILKQNFVFVEIPFSKTSSGVISSFRGIDFNKRLAMYLWQQHALPKYINKAKPSVIFHPYQAVGGYKYKGVKKIVLIHDIFHWKYTERYSMIERFFYNSYKKGCKNADKILTISETSKKEILNLLGVPQSRVAVCYEGYNQLYENFSFHPQTQNKVKETYDLPNKYFLSFAYSRVYKNSVAAITFFNFAAEKDPDLHLVLIGKISPNSNLHKSIMESSYKSRIVHIKRITTDDELAYVYRMAYYFLYFSLEEGFGLPPLEALLCGLFPLLLNKSSVEEIYGPVLPTFKSNDFASMLEFVSITSKAEKEKTIKKAATELENKYSWKKIIKTYLLELR